MLQSSLKETLHNRKCHLCRNQTLFFQVLSSWWWGGGGGGGGGGGVHHQWKIKTLAFLTSHSPLKGLSYLCLSMNLFKNLSNLFHLCMTNLCLINNKIQSLSPQKGLSNLCLSMNLSKNLSYLFLLCLTNLYLTKSKIQVYAHL